MRGRGEHVSSSCTVKYFVSQAEETLMWAPAMRDNDWPMTSAGRMQKQQAVRMQYQWRLEARQFYTYLPEELNLYNLAYHTCKNQRKFLRTQKDLINPPVEPGSIKRGLFKAVKVITRMHLLDCWKSVRDKTPTQKGGRLTSWAT